MSSKWTSSIPRHSESKSTRFLEGKDAKCSPTFLFLLPVSSDFDVADSPAGMSVATVTTTAPAPFDRSAADVILRSSDGVEFHVFKWILEDASPIFADMCKLPPTGEIYAVDLTETSDTLQRLLELYYPFPPQPQFVSFEDSKIVLVAANKYQLSRVASALALATLPHILDKPLRAYAFAVRYNMTELIRLLAREFLRVQDTTVYSEELEDITAGAYQRLLIYRKACAASIEELMADKWFPGDTVWRWIVCHKCVKHRQNCMRLTNTCGCGVAEWFKTYWEHVRTLLRAMPSHEIIKQMGISTVFGYRDSIAMCLLQRFRSHAVAPLL